MDIIILVILVAIVLIICNNCINKEDFHNIYNNGYVNPYIQQPAINSYIQQPVLFPIYSPYRMYYPYTPSMFAPYYSQYNILNPNSLYY
jgi:hypothetical protein